MFNPGLSVAPNRIEAEMMVINLSCATPCEAEPPVRTSSLRHPLAIDLDADFLQQIIDIGFKGWGNGRSTRCLILR
jgi:hypothetical protein